MAAQTCDVAFPSTKSRLSGRDVWNRGVEIVAVSMDLLTDLFNFFAETGSSAGRRHSLQMRAVGYCTITETYCRDWV
jgi:hypothetical protein